jgi:phosphoribosylamine--glycine ligase
MSNNNNTSQKTVVVIDAGGRGAVLVDKYAQSPHVGKIIAIPGNDLMHINTTKSVLTHTNLKTTSIKEIVEICIKEKVDLIDVAQDNAVEAGLVDELQKYNFTVVGPTRDAGQIEWDKAWSREFMKRHHIPYPEYVICTTPQQGIDFIEKHPDTPYFIKASGLAEGKGALPAYTTSEAKARIKELERFGESAQTYLIEEWLVGEEFSTYALCDGTSYTIIGSAQDHKRVYNADQGENTGGMGCSAPPLVITPDIEKQIENIITQTIHGLYKEGRPYKGVLYLGGIITTHNNTPLVKVIEYNARWGDPEAQVIIPSIQTDLYEISIALAKGTIHTMHLETDTISRVVVTAASRGYPSDYATVKGKKIFGLEEALNLPNIKIYPAAIKQKDTAYYASGGRLFYIVGEGQNVIQARKKAYKALSLIYIEGNNLHYRTDIGYHDVERFYARSTMASQK